MLDAGDAADLLDLVREEEGAGHDAAAGRRASARCSTSTAARSTRSARCPRSSPRRSRGARTRVDGLAALFRAYTARKRALGLLDLDDLLLYWRALALHETVAPLLAARFDHVLVDEYQDVNGLQADVVDALAREHRELTCVGDDLQAIYGFRAASAAHMLAFRERHRRRRAGDAGAELPLHGADPARRERRRATTPRTPYPRTLRATTPDGEPPELVWCDDEARQADAVADRVLARARGRRRAAAPGRADARVAPLDAAGARADAPRASRS